MTCPAATSVYDSSNEVLELLECPECDLPAEIERRDRVFSTSGSFDMLKIRCLQRHWFYLPAASVVAL